ncbi:MAG: DsbA family oxidoreductase [Pseudomonadota bacterium]
MNSKMKIDIVSDVSCPWCIIGYQSLHAALEERGELDACDLNWLPFELNPAMPAEGQDIREHMQQKYGATPEQSAANRENIKQRGAAVGYDFNFAAEGRIYNTFDAHRLLHWAREHGRQTELKLALFDLYFKDQGNPDDHQTLVKYAEQVGLDGEAALEVLSSGRYEKEVRAEQEFAWQQGITAVPTFIFNDKYMVNGGQPKDVFINVFEQLAAMADKESAKQVHKG